MPVCSSCSDLPLPDPATPWPPLASCASASALSASAASSSSMSGSKPSAAWSKSGITSDMAESGRVVAVVVVAAMAVVAVVRNYSVGANEGGGDG